ncbi:DUF4924 family protein [Bacteroidota bacterium]
MIIAEDKRKNNIAEYILYMWQVEDMIRAFHMNIDLIDKNVISHFGISESKKKKITNWYEGLIDLMKEEKIEEKGHFQFLSSILDKLFHLHLELLKNSDNKKYIELFRLAKPNIITYRNKSELTDCNDIDVCFHALYSLLLMRLSKKTISGETSKAMSTFSNMIAYLSIEFKNFEKLQKKN